MDRGLGLKDLVNLKEVQRFGSVLMAWVKPPKEIEILMTRQPLREQIEDTDSDI